MSNCNVNFLSPAAFILTIPGFDEIAFQCSSANLPGVSMGGPTQATPYNDFQLGGDKLNYDDLELTFFVDEECNNYSLIHNWMVGITYPQKSTQWREFVNRMKNREFVVEDENLETVDMYLTVCNSNFNENFKMHFVDAFPTSLSTLEFDTSLSDIQYLTATVRFKYTYFTITDMRDKEKTI